MRSSTKCLKRRSWLIRYLKENPGAPSIILFQVMLITCAVLMAYGNEGAANELAIYAFYALVIGLVLQFVAFFRRGRRRV